MLLLKSHCLKHAHRHMDTETLPLQGLLNHMIMAFKRQLYCTECTPTHHSQVWSSGPTDRIHVATPCPLKTVLLQVLTSKCRTLCVEIPIKIWQPKHMNFTVTAWNHNMNWYLSFVMVMRGLWWLRWFLVKMLLCALRLQIENFSNTDSSYKINWTICTCFVTVS
jgi:hypothetical protein